MKCGTPHTFEQPFRMKKKKSNRQQPNAMAVTMYLTVKQ